MKMVNLRGCLRGIVGIIAGGILYSAMIWIPIIGPFITGFITGYVSRGGIKRGFFAGLLSGICGFTLLIYLITSHLSVISGEIINILVLWIITLWNITGIFFSALGGAIGAMTSLSSDIFVGRWKSKTRISRVKTYIICPNCGSSNPESAKTCRSCGTVLQD